MKKKIYTKKKRRRATTDNASQNEKHEHTYSGMRCCDVAAQEHWASSVTNDHPSCRAMSAASKQQASSAPDNPQHRENSEHRLEGSVATRITWKMLGFGISAHVSNGSRISNPAPDPSAPTCDSWLQTRHDGLLEVRPSALVSKTSQSKTCAAFDPQAVLVRRAAVPRAYKKVETKRNTTTLTLARSSCSCPRTASA